VTNQTEIDYMNIKDDIVRLKTTIAKEI